MTWIMTNYEWLWLMTLMIRVYVYICFCCPGLNFVFRFRFRLVIPDIRYQMHVVSYHCWLAERNLRQAVGAASCQEEVPWALLWEAFGSGLCVLLFLSEEREEVPQWVYAWSFVPRWPLRNACAICRVFRTVCMASDSDLHRQASGGGCP